MTGALRPPSGRIFVLLVLLAGMLRASPGAPGSAGPLFGPLAGMSGHAGLSLAAGYGMYTDSDFQEILGSFHTDYRNSWLAFLALNQQLNGRLYPFRFEAEGQIVRHTGLQTHPEVVGLLLARLENPWLFPASFAFGAGSSYAAGTPELEFPRRDPLKARFEEAPVRRLLNYLLTEVDVGLPGSRSRLLMRIHHRSGIFGTYCLPICGSNFIAYGLKTPL